MKTLQERITNLIHKDDGTITYTVQIDWLKGCVTGWGNGYVGFPEGHKLYGVDYEKIDVSIHGGLTYGQEEVIEGVKYWVFGFDTAHWNDNPENCPESYVQYETEGLYEQLINLTPNI